MDTDQISTTTEKGPSSKRALLHKRTGVPNERNKKLERIKRMKNLLTTAGVVSDDPLPNPREILAAAHCLIN